MNATSRRVCSGGHERQRAQVVLVEDLLEPGLEPLLARPLRQRLGPGRARAAAAAAPPPVPGPPPAAAAGALAVVGGASRRPGARPRSAGRWRGAAARPAAVGEPRPLACRRASRRRPTPARPAAGGRASMRRRGGGVGRRLGRLAATSAPGVGRAPGPVRPCGLPRPTSRSSSAVGELHLLDRQRDGGLVGHRLQRLGGPRRWHRGRRQPVEAARAAWRRPSGPVGESLATELGWRRQRLDDDLGSRGDRLTVGDAGRMGTAGGRQAWPWSPASAVSDRCRMRPIGWPMRTVGARRRAGRATPDPGSNTMMVVEPRLKMPSSCPRAMGTGAVEPLVPDGARARSRRRGWPPPDRSWR